MAVCLEGIWGGVEGGEEEEEEERVRSRLRKKNEWGREPPPGRLTPADARARFASSASLFGLTDARLLPAHYEIGLVHRHLAKMKDEREAEFLENVISER